jgi:hypothetical protein
MLTQSPHFQSMRKTGRQPLLLHLYTQRPSLTWIKARAKVKNTVRVMGNHTRIRIRVKVKVVIRTKVAVKVVIKAKVVVKAKDKVTGKLMVMKCGGQESYSTSYDPLDPSIRIMAGGFGCWRTG